MEKETFDGNDIEVTETETSEQQLSLIHISEPTRRS